MLHQTDNRAFHITLVRLERRHEKFILNHNIADQSLVLNAFAQYFPLALLFATEQKYTSGLVMESVIRPPLHEQVRSVIAVTPHMA
ncbi:hypothetical protein [Aeromonas allosaccharophila]|uniref:hypothetical protein n=1 Tax=Aeromonas allosaccharophila TaxID=656 RepID=UPI003D25AAB0